MHFNIKRPLISFILFVFLLQSCGTKVTNAYNSNIPEVKKELIYPEQLKEKVKSIYKGNLPYNADSTYLKEFSMDNEMDDASIKLLVSNFSESEQYSSGYIYEVLRLNHLKLMSQYEDYVNLLDIGQLKDASAHWVGVIEKGDSALILWVVKFSSYEACPFYSGTEIFASLIHDGIVKKCVKIGEYTSGGDAPYWFENFGLFTIDKSFKINRRMYYASYDDDALQESIKSEDSVNF